MPSFKQYYFQQNQARIIVPITPVNGYCCIEINKRWAIKEMVAAIFYVVE